MRVRRYHGVGRTPEVGFNAVVLHRALQAMGFPGGLMQVQRFVRPYREQRRWAELATVRFETGRVSKPRSTTVSSGSGSVRSRRRFIYLCSRWAIRAGCTRRPIANERLTTLLDGHERALRWFGGVTLCCLYDNPRNLVFGPP